MKTAIFTGLTCAAFAVISPVVTAITIGEDGLYVNSKSSGLYVGIDVGYAKISGESFSNRKYHSYAMTETNDGFGYGVGLGYQFNKFFAAEANLLGYPENKNAHETSAIFSNNTTLALALVGIWPLDNGISFFGKVGPAYAYKDFASSSDSKHADNDRGITLFSGIGLSYPLNDSLNFRFGVSATAKTHNVPARWLTTVGLAYTFKKL